MGQWFGKNISELIFRWDMLNSDKPLFHKITKMKETNRDVLGPGANLVVRFGHFDASNIVFESSAYHLRFREGNRKAASTKFQKKVLKVNDFSKGGRHSNQLSFSGTECHYRLHLGTPHDGAIRVGYYVPRA